MVETKGFNAQDGISLQWMSWMGIRTGVISGRESPAVEVRARQCHITYVYQGHIEKLPVFEEILGRAKLDPSEVAYMGDDLTDAIVMRRAGLALAPANARLEAKTVAHYVTAASGGDGAVREAVELILKAQNLWTEILKRYEISE
jgi:3-deoxy-D-manno-octulosonate 8-phosphate phosphatase (KDO 8-P phosphatase)